MALFSALTIQTKIAQESLSPQTVLQDGTTTRVQVISQSQNGRYIVSVAGRNIEAAVQNPMTVGQQFTARISHSADGTVLLVPLILEDDAFYGGPLVLDDGSPGALLAAKLSQAGMIPDGITLQLVQFLEQGGFAIDRPLVAKARQIALRFSGKEKEAAEAALVLLEAGIEPTEHAVTELLLISCGSEHQKHSYGSQREPQDSDSSAQKKSQTDTILSLFYSEPPPEHEGLLTLINQLSKGSRHWIFMPYEWNAAGFSATGMLRLLLDTELASVQKGLLSCKTDSTAYFFEFIPNAPHGNELLFFTKPALPPKLVPLHERLLSQSLLKGSERLSHMRVRYAPQAATTGLCTTGELPLHAGGFA